MVDTAADCLPNKVISETVFVLICDYVCMSNDVITTSLLLTYLKYLNTPPA